MECFITYIAASYIKRWKSTAVVILGGGGQAPPVQTKPGIRVYINTPCAHAQGGLSNQSVFLCVSQSLTLSAVTANQAILGPVFPLRVMKIQILEEMQDFAGYWKHFASYQAHICCQDSTFLAVTANQAILGPVFPLRVMKIQI